MIDCTAPNWARQENANGARTVSRPGACCRLAQISEEQFNEIATASQQSDPSVLDRVGSYYVQHPQAIKVLQRAALAIALGQVAQRMKT